MQKYEHVKRNLKDIAINNFVGGIVWGLGATIGVSVVLAILGFIFGQINLIPVVGDFVSKINEYVLQNNPQLLK